MYLIIVQAYNFQPILLAPADVSTQAEGTSGGNFTANLFPTDANGNLIVAGRVLGSETMKITALTPVP